MNLPLKNDAATFGVLILVLAAIFYTTQSKSPGWQKFYKYVPALLLCYFVPALLHWPLGIISSDDSKLYPFVSRYILPASLLLFCISLDLKEISRLGPKALIIFLAGTIGIIIGGPLALWLVNTLTPGILPAPATELWAGLSTIAGSWIGGGANQTAIKEIFEVPNTLFGTVVVVDIAVANLWMAILLYGTGIHHKINKWLKADYSAIDRLRVKMEHFSASVTRQPTLPDLMILMGLTFGGVGLAHWLTDGIMPIMEVYKERLAAYELHALNSSFFWIVVLSTTLGILLSFTKARSFEGIGASKWASLFLYILVATIGMQMDLSQIGQKLRFDISRYYLDDDSYNDHPACCQDDTSPFLLCRGWKHGQRWRCCLSTRDSICFCSWPSPSGRTFGSIRVCHRYLWCLDMCLFNAHGCGLKVSPFYNSNFEFLTSRKDIGLSKARSLGSGYHFGQILSRHDPNQQVCLKNSTFADFICQTFKAHHQ